MTAADKFTGYHQIRRTDHLLRRYAHTRTRHPKRLRRTNATTRDLLTIQTYAESDASSAAIAKLRDNYQDEVVPKRLSVLDILKQHTDISLPFATFLHLLPLMRQYSISSSPLVDPQRVSLTISVLASPALWHRRHAFRRCVHVPRLPHSRRAPPTRRPPIQRVVPPPRRPRGAACYVMRRLGARAL